MFVLPISARKVLGDSKTAMIPVKREHAIWATWESGERVSQGLRGVRQAARERRQERFTALLHHLSVGLLRDSFYALQRQAAPGVDGVRWKDYEAGLEGRLADLRGT